MPSATVRQCAVLIGGLGTRLGQLTAATPKPLLTCGDRPFLAWLLREFLRYGVDDFLLLTGYLPEVVQAALPAITAGLPRHVRVTCSTEPVRAGTGGALYHARDQLAERFWLCNGDSMLDCNLARLLADAAMDPDAVVGRMMLRRLDDASRYGVVELQGDRVAAFQERPQPGSPGMINAGIYLLNRSVLDDIGPVCSLERDVLPVLATRGALRGTVGEGYFIDIGIQADLERAQTELPGRLHRGALFLDRDVLTGDSGSRPFGWKPGAIATIRAATDAGIHVFVVGQSGIASGIHDDDQRQWMGDEIRAAGGTLDDARFHRLAPGPSPDGLLDLMARWETDPARSLLIGNRPADATPAGVRTIRLEGRDLHDVALPLLAGIA
ncbi:sugar phosphate nucleotidyltransferase [Acidisphaera sp. S103]|uniref:sugar phosphate nucleotidyltransferase n=1 Tax=Acidisphaera sp. S103 TaxID=1747223 RepID=UPI00131D1674|nr:sugar phosphate nucleotidyltransferase [Acidisphaera sp. S103]